MPRQRDIPDDADEKWVYTQHTAAKHEILHRYLGAWLAILGRARKDSGWRHKQLVLVDAFAGRGRYMGGEPGSPMIIFDRAVEAVKAGMAQSVRIHCAEPNAINFSHLEKVCSAFQYPGVEIDATPDTFVEIGTRIADWAEAQKASVPIFVLVDPFGVKGVPLRLIRRLLDVERLEVLLTFMVRDPSRFMKEGNYAEPLTALFDGDAWRECEDAPDRESCLLLRFQDIVRPSVARWATPFRVFEDRRKIVLYYLLHLTNNDLGMREMKKAMIKKSGDMTFWPITVRPLGQLQLELDEQKPYATLQEHLASTYSGRTVKFVELLNEDYPQGVRLEPEYRAALNAMAAFEPPSVKIRRDRFTASGRPATRGIQHSDMVSFA